MTSVTAAEVTGWRWRPVLSHPDGEPGVSNVSELMNQADRAMLQARSRGGNETAVFTGEMRRQNEIRTDIELHLVTAIRNGSLLLHYQPEVDMMTGAVTGVEALVRLPHPDLGLLPPGAFIDVIQTTNLAGDPDRRRPARRNHVERACPQPSLTGGVA
jgi:predicted signal transduction protein with EAL and GGDEF domain